MNIAQKQVFSSTARGVPGQKASLNGGFNYHPNTLISEGLVQVGNFVWLSNNDPETLAVNHAPGRPPDYIDLTKVKPLGFVERNIAYPDYDPLSPGTLTLPEGSPLAVATRGDFWAVAPSDSVVGMKVFAVLANGSLLTSGSGNDLDGAVETDWVVVTAGQAGETIIISSH